MGDGGGGRAGREGWGTGGSVGWGGGGGVRGCGSWLVVEGGGGWGGGGGGRGGEEGGGEPVLAERGLLRKESAFMVRMEICCRLSASAEREKSSAVTHSYSLGSSAFDTHKHLLKRGS